MTPTGHDAWPVPGPVHANFVDGRYPNMRAFRIPTVAFVACLTVILAASGASPSRAQTVTPTAASLALPPDATVGGLGLADWTARAWQRVLSFPTAVSPAFDLTGERCAYGQSGPVFFLLQSPAEFGASETPENVTRTCTVPLGVALYAPVLQDECSTVEAPPFHGDDEAGLRACTRAEIDRKPAADLPKMVVTVDGQSVGDITRFRVATPMYTLLLPPGNIIGTSTPVADSMSDGYQVLLAPPAAGPHVVTITTPYAGGVHTVTYQLTVAAPPSASAAASPAASPGA
jgi:hypothetical protein